MLRCVVFDFDGVIIDTETSEYLAWNEIFKSYGLELDKNRWATTIGTRGLIEPYDELKAFVPNFSESYGAIIDKKREIVASILENSEPLPGIFNWLKRLKDLGIKMGIASSSSNEWLELHLRRLGLRCYFESVVGFSETVPPKPDPLVYKKVLGELQVDPGESLAIEDSKYGIMSAKSAGLYVLAIPTSWTRGSYNVDPDIIVTSLSEITVDEVMKKLFGSQPR